MGLLIKYTENKNTGNEKRFSRKCLEIELKQRTSLINSNQSIFFRSEPDTNPVIQPMIQLLIFLEVNSVREKVQQFYGR